MTGEPDSTIGRVTTLELFFDLVFVFTITQLTTLLAHEASLRGVVQVALMLGVIWWMYDAYAWLTNAVTPDRASIRVVLFGGMAGWLVIALAVPHVFEGHGAAFGIAYVVIVLVHSGLFTQSPVEAMVNTMRGFGRLNLACSLLVLAGCLVHGDVQYVLFALAFVILWSSPRWISQAGIEVRPAHFVERHGLVVIIAIGESVVAIGIGAGALELDLALCGVIVLALALNAALWWTYFGGDDERAEEALTALEPHERALKGVDAYGFCHLGLLLGVIGVAAALEVAVSHPGHHLETWKAVFLGGGVALFLLGDVAFRRVLSIADGWERLGAALLAAATIPLGAALPAVVEIGVLAAILGGMFVVELRGAAEPLASEA